MRNVSKCVRARSRDFDCLPVASIFVERNFLVAIVVFARLVNGIRTPDKNDGRSANDGSTGRSGLTRKRVEVYGLWKSDGSENEKKRYL